MTQSIFTYVSCLCQWEKHTSSMDIARDLYNITFYVEQGNDMGIEILG